MVHFKPIDFAQTNFFSSLVLDYNEQKERLKPFYRFSNDNLGIHDAINQVKQFTYNRKILVNTLIKQYQSIDYKENIQFNLMLNSSTFAIVTAHQPIIFGGPLYFIIKIANAIRLAQDLKKQFPAFDFVPFYWMGSEDHDMEEIGQMQLFGKKIIWENDSKGPSGRKSMDSIQPLLQALNSILGNSPNADKLKTIFEQAYSSEKDLKSATRQFVHSIFGNYGLICIDGDDVDLKALFVPIIKKEIFERKSFDLVEASSTKLVNLGYKKQSTPRQINFFYLGDTLRERIIWDEMTKTYKVNNTEITFSEDEMRAEIENNPQCFSPNVIMRPLYQQTILPAIAFIGGGGEISYWLQLKAVFDAYNTFYPVLLLRNSVQPILQSQFKKWQKLGLDLSHIFFNTKAIQTQFLTLNAIKEVDIDPALESLNIAFQELNDIAKKVDVNLLDTIGAEQKKTENVFKQIKQKLTKAQNQQFENQYNQIDNIKKSWFPNENLWEREESFASLYLKFGDKILNEFIDNMNPLDLKFYLILED
jgi:bacillithiol biosynthesis cysteine-adding enzyme BshC